MLLGSPCSQYVQHFHYQEDAVWTNDHPVAHDVLLAALQRPELLSFKPNVIKVGV
jgi:hypothetical protein